MANQEGIGAQVQINDLLILAAERARGYVRDVAERRVEPSKAAVTALAELQESFPQSPNDPGEVIAKLDQIGSAATVATTGGRYFGFVNGGMVPAALAALGRNWKK